MLSSFGFGSCVKGSIIIISIRSVSPSEYMLILKETIITHFVSFTHWDHSRKSHHYTIITVDLTWHAPWHLFRAGCTFLQCTAELPLSEWASYHRFPPGELAGTWENHLQRKQKQAIRTALPAVTHLFTLKAIYLTRGHKKSKKPRWICYLMFGCITFGLKLTSTCKTK